MLTTQFVAMKTVNNHLKAFTRNPTLLKVHNEKKWNNALHTYAHINVHVCMCNGLNAANLMNIFLGAWRRTWMKCENYLKTAIFIYCYELSMWKKGACHLPCKHNAKNCTIIGILHAHFIKLFAWSVNNMG